jgi:two-component system KDP operon response regulator KdpE
MSIGVLLIEDDKELRSTLRQALAIEGYRVASAASLADARLLWSHASPLQSIDLVLLDLGLPDGEGVEFLNELRARSTSPVIVISARQLDGDKVQLLDQGADDYLVKPFSVVELLARMRVALRHRGRTITAAITYYQNAELEIDVAKHRVNRDGAAVHLTPTEFNLLARLVRNTGQVVTHRQLLLDVWGSEYTEHTHYLRLYMGQLRAKLEADPAQPRFLITETGVGYRLADPAQ